MKIRLLPFALAAAFLISTLSVLPQSSPINPGVIKNFILPGIVVGYNQSMHSVDLASFAADPQCPFFSNGNSTGFFAGVCYEQLFGDAENSTSSLVFRLMYNTLPASFEKEGDKYPSILRDPLDSTKIKIIESSTRHTVKVTYSLVSFDALYKLNLFKTGFGIYVGPTFDFSMTKTMKQTMEIVEPLNVKFKTTAGVKYENNDRTIVPKDGDVLNSSGFRFGLKAGVIYELILKNGFYVVPNVCYNFGVTKLTSSEDWRVNALQIGIDIRYALSF